MTSFDVHTDPLIHLLLSHVINNVAVLLPETLDKVEEMIGGIVDNNRTITSRDDELVDAIGVISENNRASFIS